MLLEEGGLFDVGHTAPAPGLFTASQHVAVCFRGREEMYLANVTYVDAASQDGVVTEHHDKVVRGGGGGGGGKWCGWCLCGSWRSFVGGGWGCKVGGG